MRFFPKSQRGSCIVEQPLLILLICCATLNAAWVIGVCMPDHFVQVYQELGGGSDGTSTVPGDP